jgi:TPR repeat protein
MKFNIKTIFAIVAVGLVLSLNAFADGLADANKAVVNNDFSLAVRLLKSLADKGNPVAQSFVGAILFNGKGNQQPDVKTAVHYLQLSADNPESSDKQKGGSLWMLSGAYISGEGGLQKDMGTALSYIWKSARLGNENATNQLTESVCETRGANCPFLLKDRLARCEEPCLQRLN